MLTIHIEELPDGLNMLERDCPQNSLGIDDSVAKFDGPLKLQVSLIKTGDEVVVDGTITGVLLDQCSRCLCEIRRPQSAAIHIFGSVRKPSMPLLDLEESQPDRYTAFHDGKTLDIGNQVRETVVLSLPIRRLCKPDCRGICSRCGADLNTESCKCGTGPTDKRWEPLKDLIRKEGGKLDGTS